MSRPKNFEAIIDWCKVNRPDLVEHIENGRNIDAFILLLGVGFEAGRKFQVENPAFPLNEPGAY